MSNNNQLKGINIMKYAKISQFLNGVWCNLINIEVTPAEGHDNITDTDEEILIEINNMISKGNEVTLAAYDITIMKFKWIYFNKNNGPVSIEIYDMKDNVSN